MSSAALYQRCLKASSTERHLPRRLRHPPKGSVRRIHIERLGLFELTFSDRHLLEVGLQPLASHIGPGTALIVDEVRLPVRDRFGGATQSRQ